VITHWDELEPTRREKGHIAAEWTSLTGAGSHMVGVQRIRVDAGKWATPLHLEGFDEEIFYVLAGDGVSVQDAGDGMEAYAVAAGDCLVHRALEHAHTLMAGPDPFSANACRVRKDELRLPLCGALEPRPA
jgi:uncharacterized cupin superfamily protein